MATKKKPTLFLVKLRLPTGRTVQQTLQHMRFFLNEYMAAEGRITVRRFTNGR